MADVKDILRGLECIETNGVDCRGCHYRDAGDCCAIHIAKDATELLKQQKTGTWYNYKDGHTCPCCKETTYVDKYVWMNDPYEFCPRCGAKLENDEG